MSFVIYSGITSITEMLSDIIGYYIREVSRVFRQIFQDVTCVRQIARVFRQIPDHAYSVTAQVMNRRRVDPFLHFRFP